MHKGLRVLERRVNPRKPEPGFPAEREDSGNESDDWFDLSDLDNDGSDSQGEKSDSDDDLEVSATH